MAVQKSSPILLVALILAALTFRAIPFFVETIHASEIAQTPLFSALFGLNSSLKTSSLLWSAFVMLATVLLTYFVVNSFWIFESRSVISMVIMALLLSSGIGFQMMSPVSLTTMFVLFSFLVLFGSESISITPLKIFNLTLLIISGSFLNPYLLYLFPLYWAIIFYFRFFTFKSVLATLAGLLTMYWMLMAILLLRNDAFLFKDFFIPVTFNLLNISQISNGFYVYIPGLTILALVSFFSFSREYSKMKQNHRVIFFTANALAIYVLVLAILGILPIFQALSTALVSFTLLFSLFYHKMRLRSKWIFFGTFLFFVLCSFIDKF